MEMEVGEVKLELPTSPIKHLNGSSSEQPVGLPTPNLGSEVEASIQNGEIENGHHEKKHKEKHEDKKHKDHKHDKVIHNA